MDPAARLVLPDDVAQLLEGGPSMHVGTRDRALRPTSTRAFGARVHADRTAVTVYLPRALASRVLDDVDEGSPVALTVCRPFDDVTYQIKGRAVGHRPSGPEDRAIQERYRVAFLDQLYAVGLPKVVFAQATWWPSVALELAVERLYGQTPGPRAGEALPGGAP